MIRRMFLQRVLGVAAVIRAWPFRGLDTDAPVVATAVTPADAHGDIRQLTAGSARAAGSYVPVGVDGLASQATGQDTIIGIALSPALAGDAVRVLLSGWTLTSDKSACGPTMERKMVKMAWGERPVAERF